MRPREGSDKRTGYQSSTGHDIIKRLRDLRSTPGKQGSYARLADSSDDLLLSIAEAFQPGDAELMKWALDETEDTGSPIRKMLHRLQAAAERLEGKP